METSIQTEPVAEPAVPTNSFRVLAVGRAGIAAMEEILRSVSLERVDFIALHTEPAALDRSSAPFRLALNSGQPRGLGAGGDPTLGQAAAERDSGKIQALVQGARLVFLITGLGAGTGTGVAPVVARIAREAGALVLAVATLPFHCEGRIRAGHAQAGLQALKGSADVVLTVPNQRVLATLEERATASEVFAEANRLLGESVIGLWRMLHRPGLIQLDFSSVERLLRGRHSESVCVSATATGEHRVRSVVEHLMNSPFLSPEPILQSADAVLIAVTAGADVPFQELEQVLGHLQRQSQQAQIVAGASVDPGFAGAIGVLVVASIGGSAPLPEAIPALDPTSEPALLRMGTELREERPGLGEDLGRGPSAVRSTGGLVPPAPELSAEQREQLGGRGVGVGRGGVRKKKAVQSMFNFDVISRGRFEKTEATVLHGQDLDVPTFIRRGIALN